MRHSENHAKQAKHLPKSAQSDPRSGYVLPTSQDGASDAVLRVTRLLYHSASAQDGTEPLAGAAEAEVLRPQPGRLRTWARACL